MGLERQNIRDGRADERIPVFHRTRAVGPEGQPLSVVIVDISARGLLVRCDTGFPTGARLQIQLPSIGMCFAEVRWSLGGRVGCELERPIGLESYYELLTLLARETATRR